MIFFKQLSLFSFEKRNSLFHKDLRGISHTFLSTIIIVVGMLVFNSESSQAACPAGYAGPYTIPVTYSPGCRIDVEYCLSTGITTFGMCDIFIGNITFWGGPPMNCLSAYSRDLHSRIVIPWGLIIQSIIQLPANSDCFPVAIMGYPPCDENTTRPIVKISTGGCYHYIGGYDQSQADYYERFEACDVTGQSYCRTEYTFCREFVNGQWKLKIEEGEAIPQYNCAGPSDCFRLCAP